MITPQRKTKRLITKKLITKRLIIRSFVESDIGALYQILKDREANTFLPWFPVQDMDGARAVFEAEYAAESVGERACVYAVCLREDNIPVGYIKVERGEGHDFGYGLRREYWHRGIATEAAKAVVEQVKNDGMPYITATHDINNPRSGGVMRQIGMKYQYSYEEQWQPKDIRVTFRMYQLNLDGQEDRVYRKYWEQSAVHFVEADL
ncbi:MAG: GNAT family N-acetyltransferase [Lachnospiraceae bacterium]|nr:GNAT family N-acetyltransferase [Lachnospiraceae bacterium]